MGRVFIPGTFSWKQRSPPSGQSWGQIEQEAQLLFQTQPNSGGGGWMGTEVFDLNCEIFCDLWYCSPL